MCSVGNLMLCVCDSNQNTENTVKVMISPNSASCHVTFSHSGFVLMKVVNKDDVALQSFARTISYLRPFY